MAFSDYTKASEVRAVLGVSVKEIADSVIEANVYLTGLLEALRALEPTITDTYKTLVAGSRDAKQNRFVMLVQTYAAYHVAKDLIPNAPMWAPQVISDGKTALNRIANPYEHLLPAIQASLSMFGASLLAAYGDIDSSIAVPVLRRRTMVVATGTAVDPVTG